MSDTEEIRARLEAVRDIDWTPGHDECKEEYYGLWTYVGPAMVLPDEEFGPAHYEAAVAFLSHAAADIRHLLALLGQAADE